MFERFCAFYDGNTARSEASVRLHKDQLANMVEVAFAYYEVRHDGKDGVLGEYEGSTDSSSGKTERNDSREDAVNQVRRAWWSLSEVAQKTWHSRLNTKSYPFVDIEEDHFRTIAAIIKQRSALSHQGYKFPFKANFADHEALARRATELLEDQKLPLKQYISINGSALNDDSKPIIDDAASNHSGSSTESDDEILECWDEIVPRSPVRGPRSSDESVQQLNDANDTQKGDNQANARCDQMAAPQPKKRSGKWIQRSWGLSTFWSVRQGFSDMFRQAKEARKKEQQERRHVLQQIQQEKIAQTEMLERVMRSEDATRKARDEWKQERDEIKREWAAIREQERQR